MLDTSCHLRNHVYFLLFQKGAWNDRENLPERESPSPGHAKNERILASFGHQPPHMTWYTKMTRQNYGWITSLVGGFSPTHLNIYAEVKMDHFPREFKITKIFQTTIRIVSTLDSVWFWKKTSVIFQGSRSCKETNKTPSQWAIGKIPFIGKMVGKPLGWRAP